MTSGKASLGQEATLSRFDAVLGLLRGSSCEERVAGLLISSKTFEKVKGSLNDSQVEQLISTIVDAVSVRFIMRMLTTSVDATDGQMKAAARHILRVAAGYPSVASKLLPYAPLIINELAGRDQIYQAEEMGVLLALAALDPAVGKLACDKALDRILNTSQEVSSSDIRGAVELIASLSASVSVGGSGELPRDTAASLRSALVRSLHGAAAVASRESAYDALSYLLRSVPSSWTVESAKAKEKPGEFASFLAIMVCGDLRIFFEENLSTYYASCDGGAPARPAAYAERCQNRIAMCFTIIDCVLQLLIGDISEGESVSDPLWSQLPATALLAIQKAVHSVTQDLLDFTKEAHSMAVTHAAYAQSAEGRQYKKWYLTLVVERGLMSIVKWALEDPELMQLLASNVSEIMFFSEIAKTLSTSVSELNVSRICGRTDSSKLSNIDVFQSLLPVCLEIASESPLLSSGRATSDVMWDDDTMNMLNSSELLCRLVVFVTEIANLLSGKERLSVVYDEALTTGMMAGELILMLADMCIAANYYSFDTMAISKLGREWGLMVSSIKTLEPSCGVLIEIGREEGNGAVLEARYKELRKVYRRLAKLGIKF